MFTDKQVVTKTLLSAAFQDYPNRRVALLVDDPPRPCNPADAAALVGKRLGERFASDGLHLVEVEGDEATLEVPDTDYFITLDADSILVPDYASRLIHLMEQPEHTRTAVAQTPYSAIPNAPRALERIAGATTDIQYIIHQGFTGYDATY